LRVVVRDAGGDGGCNIPCPAHRHYPSQCCPGSPEAIPFHGKVCSDKVKAIWEEVEGTEHGDRTVLDFVSPLCGGAAGVKGADWVAVILAVVLREDSALLFSL